MRVLARKTTEARGSGAVAPLSTVMEPAESRRERIGPQESVRLAVVGNNLSF